jgi:hypothetical protein
MFGPFCKSIYRKECNVESTTRNWLSARLVGFVKRVCYVLKS